MSLAALATAAAEAAKPAGGAAIGQVIGATAGAMVATAAVIWLLQRHRSGKGTELARAAAAAERATGLPGWASLPSAIATASLLIALLGMYWDIALHINVGRDEGPLANPAHYLILVGLFGVFVAGAIAIALPVGERPSRASIRIAEGWYAPVGGVLMAAAGGYALIGFPLDDVWHRLFGQDVTLWGPTHLMLIGGAAMTLIGQALLLAEAVRAKPSVESRRPRRGVSPAVLSTIRRTAAMGGLLIGLSTFQAEFDFGVPQFRLVFQPLLIAFAAGVALVAARVWIGRGAAIGAAVFFVVVRGLVAIVVGPVLGETTPWLPLYLGEAIVVELVALAALSRLRPLAFGALAGLLAGAVGFWAEWPWINAVMPIEWTSELLPEGWLYATAGGLAGGAIGGLLAAGLLGELPRPSLARGAFAAAVLAICVLVASGLVTTEPGGMRAHMTVDERAGGDAVVTARIDPPDAAEDAEWVNMTAWQGGGLVVNEMERVSEGVYRTTEPVPVSGEWKTLFRVQDGRAVLAAPVYLPNDPAIPATEIPARAEMTRPLVDETQYLQRELKDDVPGWLWGAAGLVVLLISLTFLAALAWGVDRVSRGPRPPRSGTTVRPAPVHSDGSTVLS
jgi:hypothetical protein